MTPEDAHHLIESIIEKNRRTYTGEVTFAEWAVYVRDQLSDVLIDGDIEEQ